MGVMELITVFPFEIECCHFQSNPYISVIIPCCNGPDKFLLVIRKYRGKIC